MTNISRKGHLTVEGQMRHLPSIEKLKSLTTKRLLAYKNKWMRGSPFEADMHQDCGESCHDWIYIQVFYTHLDQIKAILSSREHVDRPGKPTRERKVG